MVRTRPGSCDTSATVTTSAPAGGWLACHALICCHVVRLVHGAYQGRYVLRHDWTGGETCPAAEEYRRLLPERHESEAQTLAALTGWKIEEIRKQVGLPVPAATEDVAWWRRIWK